MLRRIFIACIVLLLSYFSTAFAQTRERQAYPLSYQDSVLVDKYAVLSNEWKSRGDEKEASRYQNEIALIYWNHNQYRKAIEHYERSISLNKDLDNENGIAMINNNLGMLYSDVGDFSNAYDYFQKTLAARRANKEKVGMISALINLSVVLNNLDRYDESIKNLEEALDLARNLNDPDQMKSCYGMLSETYEKAGNSEKSIYYFELYRTFHEKVQTERVAQSKAETEAAQLRAQLAEAEKRNKELQIQQKDREIAKYDSTQKNLLQSLSRRELEVKYFQQEKRLQELEALEARERQQIAEAQQESAEARQKNAELVRNGVLVGLFLILGFAFFLYRNYQEKKRINNDLLERNEEVNQQNEEIRVQRDQIVEQANQLQVVFNQVEEKNLQITQSINYAQRIQEAMLTREPDLPTLLPESFVLFKPRDVVSGDFYWYGEKHGKVILAAIDCTGHGVPGAFMSMIGNNLLDIIVHTQGITKPDLILSTLHRGVIEALHQDQTENKDGMDAALIVFDKKTNTLSFSGANRPLYYVQDQTLEVIKGDRNAIGGYRKGHTGSLEFTTHSLDLHKPITFFISSDGYADQFGGERDRKFMTKNFKKLCLKVHHLPMDEQKAHFKATIEDWMGDTPQIDDILLIGGRFGVA